MEELNPLEDVLNGGTISRNQFLTFADHENDNSETFTELIGLMTEDFRVIDIVNECAEAVEQRAIGMFNAVLNEKAEIRDSMNKSLEEIKQMEQISSSWINRRFNAVLNATTSIRFGSP